MYGLSNLSFPTYIMAGGSTAVERKLYTIFVFSILGFLEFLIQRRFLERVGERGRRKDDGFGGMSRERKGAGVIKNVRSFSKYKDFFFRETEE